MNKRSSRKTAKSAEKEKRKRLRNEKQIVQAINQKNTQKF
jgi:hypothetical protein